MSGDGRPIWCGTEDIPTGSTNSYGLISPDSEFLVKNGTDDAPTGLLPTTNASFANGAPKPMDCQAHQPYVSGWKSLGAEREPTPLAIRCPTTLSSPTNAPDKINRISVVSTW